MVSGIGVFHIEYSLGGILGLEVQQEEHLDTLGKQQAGRRLSAACVVDPILAA